MDICNEAACNCTNCACGAQCACGDACACAQNQKEEPR